MIKDNLIDKGIPTKQYHASSIVRAYIISETLIWSAWNFIAPIVAIFITDIQKGTIDNAATAYSIYLVSRVLFELYTGKYLTRKSIAYKFLMTVLGIIIISISYVGLAFSELLTQTYIFYALLGLGIGIATPAKNSLFSSHLDKSTDAAQWGILDASVFLSMALAAVIGGFIARVYGFTTLFIIAAVANFLGIIPYLLYVKKWKKSIEETILS
ncbi:MAG: hypothetical protein KatS3mg089_0058 [Patescibacteria group bacterium]|nr:MAG: hypothetical protein KatS3mg089_0058 [Patescibacteria group bacterium]